MSKNLSKKEIEKWEEIAKNIYLPYDSKRQVFLQQDGFLDKEFNIKYGNDSKTYKNSRLASRTESNKIINTNAKKDSELFPLSLEEILHGTKKPTSQCHLLKDYINIKFVK